MGWSNTGHESFNLSGRRVALMIFWGESKGGSVVICRLILMGDCYVTVS